MSVFLRALMGLQVEVEYVCLPPGPYGSSGGGGVCLSSFRPLWVIKWRWSMSVLLQALMGHQGAKRQILDPHILGQCGHGWAVAMVGLGGTFWVEAISFLSLRFLIANELYTYL